MTQQLPLLCIPGKARRCNSQEVLVRAAAEEQASPSPQLNQRKPRLPSVRLTTRRAFHHSPSQPFSEQRSTGYRSKTLLRGSTILRIKLRQQALTRRSTKKSIASQGRLCYYRPSGVTAGGERRQADHRLPTSQRLTPATARCRSSSLALERIVFKRIIWMVSVPAKVGSIESVTRVVATFSP